MNDRWKRALCVFGISAVWLGATHNMAMADDVAEFHLTSPLPYQVTQRQGCVPTQAHSHQAGGAALGFALVPIAGDIPWTDGVNVEYRVVVLAGAFGQNTEWAALTRPAKDQLTTARIPAGGWYRLEVRAVRDGKTISHGAVEPFGVGEVFMISGQSYASHCNDELLKVDDPLGRVSQFDPAKKSWRVAHDIKQGEGVYGGGTIWPPFGDMLLPLLRVPVGLVNVSVGGTSSRQWLPGQKLFQDQVDAGQAVGRFRAVLWQQGESDVIEKVSTETYVRNLTLIRAEMAKQWGFDPPWLLAKSTLHPTVYNSPVEEGRIRAAIDELWRTRGFRPGPDTDILDGENRGGPNSLRHFSGIGQRRAALMWFAAVWQELNRADSTP